MAWNRVQQRFDRMIREAVAETKRIQERESAASAERRRKKSAERAKVPTNRAASKRPAMMLIRLADETTALVPWDHPEAVAWRTKGGG